MIDYKKKIILIGGPPGAGKTTLGAALAARLGVTSLSMDDLVTAAIAVTTPESHPGLHVIRKASHLEYYTNSTVEQLKSDALIEHDSTKPIFKRIVRKRSRQGNGIVIDGWYFRPGWVKELELNNVHAVWIIVSESVLEERERKNEAWIAGSKDPELMLRNFLARSYWYNNLIRSEVDQYGMNSVLQDGSQSVDDLCEALLEGIKF